MSENEQRESPSGSALNRIAIAEMLVKNFEKLSDNDQKMFLHGPLYLAGNSSFAGLIANSLYRRSLHVTQATFIAGMPVAVLPFLTTASLYNILVCHPLLAGELNCPTCSVIRGALVGLVGAGVYPIVLALSVNVGVAFRYNTAPMPETGNMLRYWADLSKPILRKMRAVLLLQTLFGTYLGSKHFDIYAKLAQITYTTEDLKD